MPTIVGQNFFPRDFFSSMQPLDKSWSRPLTKMRTLPARPHSQAPTGKTMRRRVIDQSYFGETPQPSENQKLVEFRTLKSQKVLQPVNMRAALEEHLPNHNPFSSKVYRRAQMKDFWLGRRQSSSLLVFNDFNDKENQASDVQADTYQNSTVKMQGTPQFCRKNPLLISNTKIQ
jgi:hypothetical protein